ncbi:hypothetical protein C2845_PM12G04800 [Panicum miliaceum]|uniref:Uncharacterized protein n=1 Tax=Panicum miliaceum TaxID=4540 RepID=A0A3L6QFG4_PANMI|nr:hypothetical protein C2845_PM12G04800 [Panicum miliaceum]
MGVRAPCGTQESGVPPPSPSTHLYSISPAVQPAIPCSVSARDDREPPRAWRHSSACRAVNRKQPVRVRDAPAT